MIRLYADENVDDRIVRGLRLRGIDVVTVVEAGMIGKPDPEHLSRATLDGRVLLTSDHGFFQMHLDWLREGKSHAGIIYYSVSRKCWNMHLGYQADRGSSFARRHEESP